MKESITKFDLEAAFKALDEIEVPKVGTVRANKPALTEIFSRKTKFDALMEEYYDIGSNEGLEDAKDARDAEIAQAKLDRIEKIVDLDAESAEDLLTSYVGKFIMQCPQCMTLFYKNPEDVVASEEDPATVNVNEVCQHCGNESGYSLIGKVGEAETEEAAPEEIPADGELNLDVESEEATEEPAEEVSEEDLNFDDELETFDLDNIEDDVEEEKKKEESFNTHTGETLVEDVQDDKDLDAKLDAHNEYIEYLRNMITQEEAALEKTENAQVKDAIQRRIDAFKADLEAALPEAVKNDEALEEPVEEVEFEPEVEEETEKINESLTEGVGADTKATAAAIADVFAKDDKNTSAKKVSEVIQAIPDNFVDQLFDVAKQKVSDIKLNQVQKEKLIAKSQGELTAENTKDCDTLGKILALVDGFEWAKTNPKLLKGFLMTALTIVAIIEPGPVVDIITMIVGTLPDNLVAKIVAILNLTSVAGLVGTAANQLYKKAKKVESMANNTLTEVLETEVSDAEFSQLISSPEFKKPISDAAVMSMLSMEESTKDTNIDNVFSEVEELQEDALQYLMSDALVELYGNVAGFKLKECSCANNKFMVEGVVIFTSGNTRKLTYTFNEALVEDDKVTLRGLNEKLGSDKQFFIVGRTENKTLITESFKVAKN